MMSFKTEFRQQLKLSPRLMQSMEILRMNADELTEYLNRVSEENPVMEREENGDLLREWEALRRQASWLDDGPTRISGGGTLSERGAVDRETESLGAFLRDQLARLRLPGPLSALCGYLIEMLDDDGYLETADIESVRELGVPEELLQEALRTLRGLEPAGIGACDLSERICLQLERQEGVPAYVLMIARDFLPELGQRRYGPICKALGVSKREAQDAAEFIASLNPRPAQGFASAESTRFVRPDIFVIRDGETLRVILNECAPPRFRLSADYERLLRESDDPDTRDYLREKTRQAKWILDSLERRGTTLRRCAETLVTRQRAFFMEKTAALVPMKLLSLAEELSLHPSTVSRAVRGKYLQCRRGTYPLRFFFSPAAGGAEISRQSVKLRLAELVRREDPRRPWSDEKLRELLSADGAEISRRTVAKYRMECGIPSSTARKRVDK
ncbi:MAG: RNA polymerase factor sigma-54 [Oscillospiraceae bacterium]|nr:RNA polymerase factor sigma-54 [Oscillospiraceae bacterium]